MSQFKVACLSADYPHLHFEEAVLSKIGAEVVRVNSDDEEEILRVAGDADALMVQYTNVTGELLSEMPKVQVMVRYGVGYDNFDLPGATEHGVYAVNVPDYCMTEVACHSVALMLALIRKIVVCDKGIKAGGWNAHIASPIHDMAKMTLGIVGLGRIGQATVLRAAPLFGGVVACDPYISETVFAKFRVEQADLRTLLQVSDVVSLHVPLIRNVPGYADTYHLIGEPELKAMKESAYLINTARGAVVDTDALIKALQEKWIAGAGIDVLELEPPASDSPLLKLDNIILTPHSAYRSEESMARCRTIVAEEIVRVLQGGEPRSLLNPDARPKHRQRFGG